VRNALHVARHITLALTLLAPSPLVATQEPPPGMTAQELSDIQRRMREAAELGEGHALLRSLAGEWEELLKLWPSPGAEAMITEGRASAHMILDGRFLWLESNVSLPGQETGSVILMGFDGRSGEFTTLGMDASATYWVTGRGTYDQSVRTITMSGTDYQPIIGHVQEYDFVLRLVDESTFVWEVWFKDEMHTRGGAPHKMVEITFNRRGDSQ